MTTLLDRTRLIRRTTTEGLFPWEGLAGLESLPGVLALVADAQGVYQWFNDAFMAFVEKRMPGMRPTWIYDFMPRALAEVVRSQTPRSYLQFFADMRRLTTVWPMAPRPGHGPECLVTMVPDLICDAKTDGLPLIKSAVLGNLKVLSKRELIVLRLAAEGLCAHEIAHLEHRSVKTIENQVRSIYAKLGVGNRSELTRYACERGILAFLRTQWGELVDASSTEHQAGEAEEDVVVSHN